MVVEDTIPKMYESTYQGIIIHKILLAVHS